MGFWQIIRKTKELYGWYRFAVAVALLFVSGAGLAIGGVVWLVETGIPLPIALMAGYCTLVGAVYLAMAPMAFRFLAKSQTASASTRATPEEPALNYEAWRHIDKFTINQAAHLWCDIDPLLGDTLDTAAWQRALWAAIQKGELRSVTSGMSTELTRDSLKEFAKLHGYNPRFLRDR